MFFFYSVLKVNISCIADIEDEHKVAGGLLHLHREPAEAEAGVLP